MYVSKSRYLYLIYVYIDVYTYKLDGYTDRFAALPAGGGGSVGQGDYI